MEATEPALAQEPRRRRPRDRKQQLIAIARQLFVERGFANVSMALIAERAGITPSALYRHFDSKQMLLDTVLEESFAYFDEPVVSASLEGAVDEALDTLIGRPYLAELWTSEARHLPADVQADLRRRFRTRTHAFERPLLAERRDLDEGQVEMLLWALQSVLSFLGTGTTRTPWAVRRPVVRAAALALVHAPLVPSSPAAAPVPAHPGARECSGGGLAPVSTRERLLLTAIEAFSERGYVDTAIAEIGAAVGVTGPSLYAHFPSKIELLRDVHERGKHAFWLNLDAALGGAQTASEALDALIAGHVHLSRTWDPMRLQPVGHPELSDVIRSAWREYVAEWTGLLQQVDPAMEPREARMRVLIALKVINDLHRTPHLTALASFADNLVAIARTILREDVA